MDELTLIGYCIEFFLYLLLYVSGFEILSVRVGLVTIYYTMRTGLTCNALPS